MGLALLVSACGFNHADIEAEAPSLFARSGGTTPRDSTQNLHDTRGLPVVVGFNREFGPGEIAHVQMVPRPAQMGTVHNPAENPRQLLIEGVVFDPRSSAYRLVLDGPAMPEPLIVSYYSAEHSFKEGAMHGHVAYPRRGREPENILVYALLPPWRQDEVELTGEEETMFGRPVLGVTRTIVIPTEEDGWFRLAGLELGVGFVVVGIIDSNRDGAYDLSEDWWGYYQDVGGRAVEVVAGVAFGPLFDPPLPPLFEHVDFALYAPGSLPSPFPTGTAVSR
jgi:hypothetical protein